MAEARAGRLPAPDLPATLGYDVEVDVATLIPPKDVHNHGHITGSGPSPYPLIPLGDDMLLFNREEYDPAAGDLACARAR